MRAYLATTGVLFALLAVAHVMQTIADLPRFGQEPGLVLEGPGIGLLAVALCVWAWRLFRTAPRA